jgi:hypothetical protein
MRGLTPDPMLRRLIVGVLASAVAIASPSAGLFMLILSIQLCQ